MFYDQIEGFDYKEGHTYKLEVNVSKIENPPADGSSLKYKLVKLIYKELAKEKIHTAHTLLGKWKVTNIVGMDSLAINPTLIFKDTKISGRAGCNNYGADYTLNDGTISIGLAMATKMYCTNMPIEKAFFSCLQKTKSYKIVDGKLILYSQDNKELLSCSSSND